MAPYEYDVDPLTVNMLACNTMEKAEILLSSHTKPILLQSYIDGEFQARDLDDAPHIDSFMPQKGGAPVAKVPISQPADVELAIQKSKLAFQTWSKTTRAYRSKRLRQIGTLLQQHAEAFAVWESIDQGKTLERARVEVERAVTNFLYFASYIEHEQTASRMIDGPDGSSTLTYEHRSPAGVFALISPWNMPLYLLTWKIAPCLAFGCTAVVKPSEVTSLTAFRAYPLPAIASIKN